MSEDGKGKSSAAIATLLILLGTSIAFYFLPRVMIALSNVSP